jgi:hypothetical protein
MNTADKRRSSRIASLNLTYICLDEQDNVLRQAMGRTIDLSEGGFLIETHFPMKEEYTLVATIGLEDDTIDVKGKIRHCHPTSIGKFLSGVEITSVDDADRSLWLRFIEKVLNDAGTETDSDA